MFVSGKVWEDVRECLRVCGTSLGNSLTDRHLNQVPAVALEKYCHRHKPDALVAIHLAEAAAGISPKLPAPFAGDIYIDVTANMVMTASHAIEQ